MTFQHEHCVAGMATAIQDHATPGVAGEPDADVLRRPQRCHMYDFCIDEEIQIAASCSIARDGMN